MATDPAPRRGALLALNEVAHARALDCEQYDRCLDLADKSKWPGWRCPAGRECYTPPVGDIALAWVAVLREGARPRIRCRPNAKGGKYER